MTSHSALYTSTLTSIGNEDGAERVRFEIRRLAKELMKERKFGERLKADLLEGGRLEEPAKYAELLEYDENSAEFVERILYGKAEEPRNDEESSEDAELFSKKVAAEQELNAFRETRNLTVIPTEKTVSAIFRFPNYSAQAFTIKLDRENRRVLKSTLPSVVDINAVLTQSADSPLEEVVAKIRTSLHAFLMRKSQMMAASEMDCIVALKNTRDFSRAEIELGNKVKIFVKYEKFEGVLPEEVKVESGAVKSSKWSHLSKAIKNQPLNVAIQTRYT